MVGLYLAASKLRTRGIWMVKKKRRINGYIYGTKNTRIEVLTLTINSISFVVCFVER